MKIDIAAPHEPQVQTGNRTTSHRWVAILAELGHDVRLIDERSRDSADLLIALHAVKSRERIEAFAARAPSNPIVIALSGTDIYGSLRDDEDAMRSLHRARRIVALQPLAKKELPPPLRDRVRVIYQSVQLPDMKPATAKSDTFDVCVIGNLREVKDPFLAARAAALLPSTSRVRITHIGAALSPSFEKRAIEHARTSARYEWVGPKPWQDAMRVLGRARLMVISSKSEGGANVVGEACTLGTPILATRIPGNVGLLGEDYPGLFEAGSASELAALFERAESDASFYDRLELAARARRELFTPQRERAAWRTLLDELSRAG